MDASSRRRWRRRPDPHRPCQHARQGRMWWPLTPVRRSKRCTAQPSSHESMAVARSCFVAPAPQRCYGHEQHLRGPVSGWRRSKPTIRRFTHHVRPSISDGKRDSADRARGAVALRHAVGTRRAAERMAAVEAHLSWFAGAQDAELLWSGSELGWAAQPARDDRKRAQREGASDQVEAEGDGVVSGGPRVGHQGHERWHETQGEEEAVVERLRPLLPPKAPAVGIRQQAAADHKHRKDSKKRRSQAAERLRAAGLNGRYCEEQRGGECHDGGPVWWAGHAPIHEFPV
eukprot:5578777-Prymnesium_polylepis.1